MGTIQNSINQGLGAIAGAVTTGKYLKGQIETNELHKAANELKKAELGIELTNEQEAVYNAGQALNKNTGDIVHQMVLEGNDEGLTPKEGETPKQAEARAVDEYLEARSEAAENEYQKQMDRVKNPAKSVRVKMAMKAADEAQDAINARRQLKYDLDMAKRKVDLTKKALEGVK